VVDKQEKSHPATIRQAHHSARQQGVIIDWSILPVNNGQF
jgi:hypothetical protein